MRKGISPVIASILLILVVISLSGAFVVFSGRIATEQTEAGEEQSQELTATATTLFSIVHADGRTVTVRNNGQQPLEQDTLFVTVGDERMNYAMDSSIQPEETGKLTINDLWKVGPGRHTLRIQGASSGDSMQIKVEPIDGASLDLRLNENRGNIATDSSGNGNNGIFFGTPEWTEGRVDTGIELESGDYINSPTSLAESHDYTVSMWVKWLSATGNSGNLSNSPLESVSPRFDYAIYDGDDRISIYAHPGNPSDIGTTGYNIETDVWHHVVMTRDNGVIRLYIDGIERNSDTVSDNQVDSTSVNLGKNTGFSGDPFHGIVDEVLIYKQPYAPEDLYVVNPI